MKNHHARLPSTIFHSAFTFRKSSKTRLTNKRCSFSTVIQPITCRDTANLAESNTIRAGVYFLRIYTEPKGLERPRFERWHDPRESPPPLLRDNRWTNAFHDCTAFLDISSVARVTERSTGGRGQHDDCLADRETDLAKRTGPPPT